MLTEAFTKIYAPWVGLLALIATLIVGLLQYENAKYEGSVSRVIDLAKEYRTNLRQPAIALRISYQTYEEQVVEPQLKSRAPIADCAGNPAAEIARYSCLVANFAAVPDNRANIEALKSFFDTLSVCVNKGLCDFETARSFFNNPVLAFTENLHPWLLRQQASGDSSEELFQFARRLRALERAASPAG